MKKSFFNIYENKKIIIIGNTGFKGACLTFCLYSMGSKILGISRDIITNPSLYKILKLDKKIKTKYIDISKEQINAYFTRLSSKLKKK